MAEKREETSANKKKTNVIKKKILGKLTGFRKEPRYEHSPFRQGDGSFEPHEPHVPIDYDAVQLAHALKEGFIILSITKCLFQGPPRVGKTHVKCLLLKQELEKQSTLSTPCAEHPQRAIRKVTATVYAGRKEEEQWELMDERLLAHMISRMANELNISYDDDDDVRLMEQETAAAGEVMDSLQEMMSTQPPTNVSSSDDICSPASGSGNPYQDLLYFIDSGGQPQFQEVLQAFIPNTDVLLLAFNLTQKLSDSPLIQYQTEKGTHTLGKYAISNEEIISRFARSSNRKMYVGLIGTHRDQYSPDKHETIEEKNKRLSQKFFICKDQLFKANLSNDSLLFPVNALQAEDGVFDDPVVCQLRHVIGTINNKIQVEIPLRWHTFELAIQKHAHHHGQVLAMDTCVKLSKDLHFPEEDVPAALHFLSDNNLILYYPSILPNVVFTSPQVLLDKVTELTECVYTLSQDDTTKHAGIPKRNEYLTMVKEGIVSDQILMDFPKHYKRNLLTVTKLVKIFEHLYIISCRDDGRYFMPALLPPFPPSELDKLFDPSKPPLLFDFTEGNGCAPTGLFCGVLVCLTSRERKWKVMNLEAPVRGVWSNAVCLNPPNTRFHIILIDSFYQFEVHYRCPSGEEMFLPRITQAISSAIKEVILNRQFDIALPRIGFLCEASDHTKSTFENLRSTSRHACILREEDGQLICSVDSTAELGKVTPAKKKWLPYKANSSHSPTPGDLFCSTQTIASQWFKLGTVLKIPSGTLDSIESEKCKDDDRLIAVFNDWQRNTSLDRPYTWQTIVNVLRMINNNALAEEIAKKYNIPQNETIKETDNQLARVVNEDTPRIKPVSRLKYYSFSMKTSESDIFATPTGSLHSDNNIESSVQETSV